ncbi:MAG: hypothetical protein WB643_06470 [Candidatus Bathyarchaeia archaeon]
MPTKKHPRRKRMPHMLVIKIPITVETLTAAMLFVQELVALARVVKLPMQTMKDGEP